MDDRAASLELLEERVEIDIDECVFCTLRDQPAPLLETPLLYAMPDKYPMAPGHVLIIAREHIPCWARGNDESMHELDETTAMMRRFLEEAYGKPVIAFENGIAGQTVFHAHLHLVPAMISKLPVEIAKHDDIAPIDGWRQVQEHFERHGHYRYVELGEDRYLLVGYSPVMHTMRRVMAASTGLVWTDRGWIKTTAPEDVAEVGRKWREWGTI